MQIAEGLGLLILTGIACWQGMKLVNVLREYENPRALFWFKLESWAAANGRAAKVRQALKEKGDEKARQMAQANRPVEDWA